MPAQQAVLIVSTAPDMRTARKIAHVLIYQKLAACVSIQKSWESRYRWQGKIETIKETLLLIKTLKKNFKKIEKTIQKNHPYKVPEILAISVVKGSQKYLKWIKSATG